MRLRPCLIPRYLDGFGRQARPGGDPVPTGGSFVALSVLTVFSGSARRVMCISATVRSGGGGASGRGREELGVVQPEPPAPREQLHVRSQLAEGAPPRVLVGSLVRRADKHGVPVTCVCVVRVVL